MGALVAVGKHLPGLACTRARMNEPQHARIRVIVSCSQMQRSGSLWSFLVDGTWFRAMDCTVWLEIQLAAICFAMRRRVRREIASSDVDLHRRVPHGCGGGRRLRRFRAPRARRARLQ